MNSTITHKFSFDRPLG